MANKSIPETTNPAVLQYRGQNLEAMIAMQMGSLDAMRRMINLMFNNIQSITERKAEFVKSSVDQINDTYKERNDTTDPKVILEQQAVVYQELCGLLANHVVGLTSDASNCCAKMANEAVKITGEQPDIPHQKSCCTQTNDMVPKKGSAKKLM